ncbi:PBP1A family penicillin-binding protein [Sporosarcina trichiuri]|uniref:PBP1A family penicillin-binding protein n=1 Tax=Sporosarcina trichiuri TaxID=3056445 RepID=UPI0025B51D33|nr:PBP1A family penicillin-binding protein [Sporosarcina sp. 0.2-SM1T-5]WJY28565.1 PBP1A family penicillin-binding protein [Sporosarcina sp. 0.2-SM1T-5]
MDNTPKSRTARRKQAEADQKTSRKKAPKKKKGVIKTIIKTIVIAGLLFLVAGAGLFAFYASTAPKLDESLLKDPLSSKITLADEKTVLYETGAEKRDYVPYDQIPDELRDAILATEDVRFFKHHGIDFWRLGGAVLANFRSGFGSQGASTLTQQVIKNSFLKNEKTLKRKAQEAWLAFQLERQYSKEEIFEMYFNKVLMSGNKYGIGTAAKYFYGKDVNELTLPEMAQLAGMPQSPNAYNPFKHPERAEKRRDIVLKLMNQHGKITKNQMEEAKTVHVAQTVLPEDQRQLATVTKYQAYIDIVMAELQQKGYKDIEAEGVTIVTAMNPDAQQSVEQALADPSNFESDTIQAGMTVVDTKTGEIVAVGGGRNYKLFNHNYASDQKRQPGSSIKPILDYGPAIEYLNWSTGQTIVDEKTKGIKANNVDGRYKGAITMRHALYESRNVPAIKAFSEVGTAKAADFAQGLGLPMKKLNQSDAIGGGGNDVSTMQMAGAYAAFGNEGIYNAPHAVKKIILRDGKTEINLTPDPVTAMKDSTAYMITDMLRDVLTASNGTGRSANIPGVDLAGKTGTTNYDADFKAKNNIGRESVPDAWFAGYTTDYTIAVWGGHEKRTDPIVGFPGGRDMPKSLFRQVMTDLASAQSPGTFKQPSSVEEAAIVVGSNPLKLASGSTPYNMKSDELFVRGTLPESTYVPPEPEEDESFELEAPTDLTADYDSDNKEIELSWNHNEPDSDDYDGDIVFDVSVSIDGGGSQGLTSTNDDSYTFGGVEPGHTYTFSVTAKAGSVTSSPASTTLMIQGEEETPPEQDADDDQQDDDNGDGDQDNDDQDDGSDNSDGQNDQNNNNGSNNNGNNNQGNNGNNGNNENNGNNGNNGNNNNQGGQGNNNNGGQGTNGNDKNQGGQNGNGNNGGSGGSSSGNSGDVSSNNSPGSQSNTASTPKKPAASPSDSESSED